MTGLFGWLAPRLAFVLVIVTASAATPHPLPNSLITVKPGFGRVVIDIQTPAPYLAIAMRAEDLGSAGRDGSASPAAVGRYYLRHVALSDQSGGRLPLSVTSADLIGTTGSNVGAYREWRVSLTAKGARAAAGHYTLHFNAVIHQIPNHFALVRVEGVQPSAGALGASREVGVIRYDFATGSIQPLTIDLNTGSLASGFASMIAVGFVHVLSGLDHVLFLAALLMVAPFQAIDGAWCFRGMDRRAFERFAAMSGAFTLGHSASLAAGTFGFDAIPVRLKETLVAISIFIAALHALRPLFPRREWMVAGGFGLIHGLAFSETLSALDLGLKAKIGALFGFNIGVEAAQLTVMSIAFPVLAISGARAMVRPRQIALLLIGFVSLLWAAERAFGLPLPHWLQT